MPRIVLNFQPNPSPTGNSNNVLEDFVAALDATNMSAAETSPGSNSINLSESLISPTIDATLRSQIARLAREEVLRIATAAVGARAPSSASALAAAAAAAPPGSQILAPIPILASTPVDAVATTPGGNSSTPRPNNGTNSDGDAGLADLDNPIEQSDDDVLFIGQRSTEPRQRSQSSRARETLQRTLFRHLRAFGGPWGNDAAAVNPRTPETQEEQQQRIAFIAELEDLFSSGRAENNNRNSGSAANSVTDGSTGREQNASGTQPGTQNQQQQQPTPTNPDAMVWSTLIRESSGPTEEFAPEISPTMADLIIKSMGELVPSDVRKQRLEAIKRPRNLASLGVDRIPDAVWEGMSRTSRQKDLLIREITQDLMVGISGIASSVATGNQRMNAMQFGMSMQMLAGIKLKLDNFRKASTSNAFSQSWKMLTDSRSHRASQANATNNPTPGYFHDLNLLAARLTDSGGSGGGGGNGEGGDRRRGGRSGGYRRNNNDEPRRRGMPYPRWNAGGRPRSGTPMPDRNEDASSDDAAED